MKEISKGIAFTCAVCPNGCSLSVEPDEQGGFSVLEQGRCVRGRLLIGKEWYFDGTDFVKVDGPMGKAEVAELVERRKLDLYSSPGRCKMEKRK